MKCTMANERGVLKHKRGRLHVEAYPAERKRASTQSVPTSVAGTSDTRQMKLLDTMRTYLYATRFP